MNHGGSPPDAPQSCLLSTYELFILSSAPLCIFLHAFFPLLHSILHCSLEQLNIRTESSVLLLSPFISGCCPTRFSLRPFQRGDFLFTLLILIDVTGPYHSGPCCLRLPSVGQINYILEFAPQMTHSSQPYKTKRIPDRVLRFGLSTSKLRHRQEAVPGQNVSTAGDRRVNSRYTVQSTHDERFKSHI